MLPEQPRARSCRTTEVCKILLLLIHLEPFSMTLHVAPLFQVDGMTGGGLYTNFTTQVMLIHSIDIYYTLYMINHHKSCETFASKQYAHDQV